MAREPMRCPKCDGLKPEWSEFLCRRCRGEES